jgi:hypothetical protein
MCQTGSPKRLKQMRTQCDLCLNISGVCTFPFLQPFPPIIAEKFDRVCCPNGTVSTAQLVRWTVLIAAPTDALRVLWMDRYQGILSSHSGLCFPILMLPPALGNARDQGHTDRMLRTLGRAQRTP